MQSVVKLSMRENRIAFTQAISHLLIEMHDAGEESMANDIYRSPEEQARLFGLHLTKCDGVKKFSAHQDRLAEDIVFSSGAPKLGWAHWHARWEQLGGKPMLEWDQNHFEWKRV